MEFSLRDYQIPKLVLNELQIKKDFNDKVISIFYCINDVSEHEKAMNLIKSEKEKHKGSEFFNFFDFENNTIIGDKKWTIIDGINVYQNSNCNETNSLVSGNDKSFERCYWGAIKL